jgi:NAD(P)-dependent dehydrogenase (short-subunit alcohol dehydrogenase family)
MENLYLDIDQMSTVLIIGASRGGGLGIVKVAPKAVYSVRAMARSASGFGARHLRRPDPSRRRVSLHKVLLP